MGKICPKLAHSRSSGVLWMLVVLIGAKTETENKVKAQARHHTDRNQS